ncbi:MAG: hypothetical protein Q7W51_10865 [Coriobacteriia bacterium]|nr:hypothetical protein [Coriobacteriia bacterium]
MVARQISRRGIAIGAVVIVLVIMAAVLLPFGQSEDSAPGDDLTVSGPVDRTGSVDTAQATSGDTAVGAQLVATHETGEIVPPESTRSTKKTSAPAAPVTDGSTPPPTTSEEQAYLEETRKVVETNAVELGAMAEAVADALGRGDEGDLSLLLADDEGDQSTFVEGLASTYPPISESALGGNVNVFAAGDTTLYFAYAIVTWTDGGITSEHTIPIVLRFVNGEWRLSTLGETCADLEFVQSVVL